MSRGEQDAMWMTERAQRHAEAVGERGPTDSWGKSEPRLKKLNLDDKDHADAAVAAAGLVLRHRCPVPDWRGRWGDGGLAVVVALAGLPPARAARAWRVWRHAHDRHVLGELLLALDLRQEKYRIVRVHENGARITSGRRLRRAPAGTVTPPDQWELNRWTCR